MGIAVVMLFLVGSTSSERSASKRVNQINKGAGSNNKKFKGGNVDGAFWKRIQHLLKVVVPSYTCKEARYIVILTMLLVLRTYMSIWLADVNGMIVKEIVARNLNNFMYRVFNLMAFSIPSSAVNSGMEYFSKLLAVSFRERLTEYFHDSYLHKMFYYKICNLDSRISNPDQRLTQDAEKWAASLSGLYLNVAKPVLDIILFSQKLAELVGWTGPGAVVAWYFISAMCIKVITPAFGKLTAIQ